MIDLFTNRRVSYNRMYYFSQLRSEDIVDRSEIAHKEKPSGFLNVREVSDEQDSMNNVGGSMRFERTTVRLKTYDNASKLQRDDIVLYQGRYWNISSINKKKMQRRNQFNTQDYFVYFIDLRC